MARYGTSLRDVRSLIGGKIQDLQEQMKDWADSPDAVRELNDAIGRLKEVDATLARLCCGQESCPFDNRAAEWVPPPGAQQQA